MAGGLCPSRFRTDAPSCPLWSPGATSRVEKGHALGRAAPGPGPPSLRHVKPRTLPCCLPVSARAGPLGTGSGAAATPAPDCTVLAFGAVPVTAPMHKLLGSLSEEPLKSRGGGTSGLPAACGSIRAHFSSLLRGPLLPSHGPRGPLRALSPQAGTCPERFLPAGARGSRVPSLLPLGVSQPAGRGLEEGAGAH